MNTLQQLRNQIDTLDVQILKLLSKRFAIVKTIGRLKKKNGVNIKDLRRWRQIQRSLKNQSLALGLNPKLIKCIYELIHEYSITEQERTK